jgi:hypothetical protein
LFLYKLYDWSPQYWHIKQIYTRNYELLQHVYHCISRYLFKTFDLYLHLDMTGMVAHILMITITPSIVFSATY